MHEVLRFGDMIALSRRGISVLSRISVSSTRPAALPSCPATLLRASPNLRRLYSSDDGPRGRSNPLIGDLPPTQQEESSGNPAAPSWPTTPSRSPGPGNADSSLEADLPPPPPPLPRADVASASPSWTVVPQSTAKDHAYNAVSTGKSRLDIDDIIGVKSGDYAAQNLITLVDPVSQPKVHTKAVSGRTVFIKPRISPTSSPNPAVALRLLERLCRDQKIKQKYHSQKFHERPGLRRKRLKSSRWRARFKKGFQATVGRVLELKRQGW